MQEGFRQKPLKQTRSLAQLKLLPQVPPQELGAAVDVGVGVGVSVGPGVPVGVDVGVSVGVPVGVGVGVVVAASVNERLHKVFASAFPDWQVPDASGNGAFVVPSL